MGSDEIKNIFIEICGGDVLLYNVVLDVLNCLMDDVNYNNKHVIHIHGTSNNNKVVLLTIIEMLFEKNEHKYLDFLLLYNNYSNWFTDKIKLCVINNFKLQNFNMIQNNVINLVKNNIIIDNTIIKPKLKFIIASSYDPTHFSNEFNEICTNINFNMNELEVSPCENIIKYVQENKDSMLKFIKNINLV
jgi:hypothetical protein